MDCTHRSLRFSLSLCFSLYIEFEDHPTILDPNPPTFRFRIRFLAFLLSLSLSLSRLFNPSPTTTFFWYTSLLLVFTLFLIFNQPLNFMFSCLHCFLNHIKFWDLIVFWVTLKAHVSVFPIAFHFRVWC